MQWPLLLSVLLSAVRTVSTHEDASQHDWKMVDWDGMSRAKQIISVLPEQSFLGRLDGANLVVITTDAVHGGQGGGSIKRIVL